MSNPETIRILCVEDDPGTARLIQKRLNRSGYEVDIVYNAEEGLAGWDGGSYHMAVVDQDLPDMTGLEVIRRLTSRGPLPPAIMVTGAGNESVAVEAMRLGVHEYIIKDAQAGYLDLIPSIVEKALEKKRLVDERLEAEARLRESEELHRLILSNISDTVLITDDNGRFTYVSHNVSLIFGYSQQEVERMGNISTLLGETPFDPSQLEREGESQHLECSIVDTSGSQHHLLITVKRVSIGAGTILYTCHDITDRKHAEDALQEAHDSLELKVKDRTADLARTNEELRQEIEERTKAEQRIQRQHEFLVNVLESLGHPFYVIDPDHYSVIIANKASGYDRGAEPTTCYRLTHRSDQPCGDREHPCPLKKVKETASSQTVRHMHYDASGNARSVDVHAYPVLDSQGKVSQIIEYSLDVTEQLLAEQQLRESEERLRTIIDSASDCIYVKDLDRRYSLVNPAMAQLMGLPESSIIGKTDEELFGEQAGTHLRKVDQRVLRGERVEGEHSRFVNGERLTFLDTRFALVVAGQIAGICGISRNITDRVQSRYFSRPATDDYPSRAMRETLSAARQVAAIDSIVLLTGESGSGKDFFARFIHDRSSRGSSPFFSINCAAVAPELAESELFGHEAGAFTGAVRKKRGLLELAEGGTLLLNEIGELSLRIQAKLLSFLDMRTFTRVGGEKKIRVNARLMAATNRDLLQEVAEGRFRADLYYRLNVFSVQIPPLRERIEDIPLLVDQLLVQLSNELQLAAMPLVDAQMLERLCTYRWPGNVRELKNVLERCLILSRGEAVTVETLNWETYDSSDWSWSTTFPRDRSVDEVADDLKHALIVEALNRTAGNKTRAAVLLRVSRDALKRRMRALGFRGGTDD